MIGLTRQAEIAIDILVLCARPQSNAPRTTRFVAELAGATKDHAAQVVAKLTRHGYLKGTRGRAGGICLARPADTMIVGDVLRLIEPSLAVEPGDSKGSAARDAVLRAAIGSFVSIFDSFTVADLVCDPLTGKIACLGCDLHTIVRNGRDASRLRRHLQHTPLPATGADKAALQAA